MVIRADSLDEAIAALRDQTHGARSRHRALDQPKSRTTPPLSITAKRHEAVAGSVDVDRIKFVTVETVILSTRDDAAFP
jgi:hypothetical protein